MKRLKKQRKKRLFSRGIAMDNLILLIMILFSIALAGGFLASEIVKDPSSGGLAIPITGTPAPARDSLQLDKLALITLTPTPTPTPAPPPASGSLPGGNPSVGSALPSDETCAKQVKRSSWEPRPENNAANHKNFYADGYRLKNSYLAQVAPEYEARVTGDFTGTTDEIFQWAACKWGFDVDTVRAQAVKESTWRQGFLGDCRGGTVAETHGCQSIGILQVKGANLPPTHPGTWPYALQSTAFNVDYTLAVRRACFDGKETWLGNGYKAGDLWGCIGRWFSGAWHDSGADSYATKPTDSVKYHYDNKTWTKPGF